MMARDGRGREGMVGRERVEHVGATECAWRRTLSFPSLCEAIAGAAGGKSKRKKRVVSRRTCSGRGVGEAPALFMGCQVLDSGQPTRMRAPRAMLGPPSCPRARTRVKPCALRHASSPAHAASRRRRRGPHALAIAFLLTAFSYPAWCSPSPPSLPPPCVRATGSAEDEGPQMEAPGQ
uniref:Uncharacterized protein n=1 Tax=Oryza punctata TaxID=4537 RepID=A0A0E0KMJ8_ORYPU